MTEEEKECKITAEDLEKIVDLLHEAGELYAKGETKEVGVTLGVLARCLGEIVKRCRGEK